MKKIVSFAITLVLFITLGLLSVPTVDAHTGSGPPFLEVNGTYSQTSPLYMGVPDFKLILAQDNGPSKYLVNQPIHFFIDGPQLQVPANILAGSTFRWTFDNNSTDYVYGVDQMYTYHQIGSHLVSAWVKGPDESDFTLIDTVQVNVVPSMDYQLPITHITVAADKLVLNEPLNFYNNTTVDKSAKVASYLWYLDNNHYSTQSNPIYSYNQGNFLNYVFLQVTDSNGFWANTAVTVDGTGAELAFANLDPNDNTKIVVNKGNGKKSTDVNPLIIFGAVIIVVAIAGGIGIARKKKATPQSADDHPARKKK